MDSLLRLQSCYGRLVLLVGGLAGGMPKLLLRGLCRQHALSLWQTSDFLPPPPSACFSIEASCLRRGLHVDSRLLVLCRRAFRCA